MVVSFPDPIPTQGKGSGVLRAISWASRMQNSHVILIIVMATHCLVCGSRMQQHCGLICAAGALSHEKSHAVNLIGAPEIRTATSSSPRNHSKYTRPSSPCRGGVWDRAVAWNGTARGASRNELSKNRKSSFFLGRARYADGYTI